MFHKYFNNFQVYVNPRLVCPSLETEHSVIGVVVVGGTSILPTYTYTQCHAPLNTSTQHHTHRTGLAPRTFTH